MKSLEFYKDELGCKNDNQVFNYLIENLKPSNITWSYFVNWDKVFENTKLIEIALNNLNYLIGKDKFDDEFKYLLKKNPSVAKVIPALVVRDGKNTTHFEILVSYKQKRLIYEDYDFNKDILTDKDVKRCLTFVKETGLKQLLISQKIKNLVDYMIGVEAGLDSNGRKNRSGHSMENIIEYFIADLCKRNRYRYLKEVNSKKIKEQFGYDVPIDKSSRRYDFVIDTGKKLFIVEANYFGGGGSKLKSTAGEYQRLFDVLKGRYDFLWITDGLGWKATTRPLRETFNHNDYIFSLSMVEKGILDFVL